MKIEKDRRVRLKVRLQVVNGDEIEKSVVEYYQGSGTMLSGLEKALEGLEAGAKKSGVIKAQEAFGDPSRRVAKTMSRKEFPQDTKLSKGMQFMSKLAGGNMDVVLCIAEVKGDEVKVEVMHPLAEKDIAYDVEVLSVGNPAAPPPIPVDALDVKESE